MLFPTTSVPSNGDPSIVPSRSCAGPVFANREKINGRGEGAFFTMWPRFTVLIDRADRAADAHHGSHPRGRHRSDQRDRSERIIRVETTVGRALLSEILRPGCVALLNKREKRRSATDQLSFRRCGLRER